MRASNEPTGARRLAEVFRAQGADLAEATAGRFLRSLDEAGYTRQMGVMGRILTEEGERRLDELTQREALTSQTSLVAQAIDPETVSGLIDLLYARRAVEPEAARLAALHATDEEIGAMAEAAHNHLDCVEKGPSDGRMDHAHGLHRLVGEASRNKVIAAIVALLVDQRNDHLARLLDNFVVSAGGAHAAAHDHDEIVDALKRHDPDAAEAAMRRHLTDLVALVERYAESATSLPSSSPKVRLPA